MRISTILTPSPLYLKGPEATLVAKLPWRAVLHLPQGLGPSLIESVASSPGTRRFGHQSIHASGVEVVDGVTHRLLAASEVRRYLGTSSPLEEARSICERRRVKVSLERYPASRISRSLSENERTKIGAFMATTASHNPKSMLKMHQFPEGNIRLMKAEKILREHLQGVACASVPVYPGLLGQLDVEEGPSGLCALDGNKDGN